MLTVDALITKKITAIQHITTTQSECPQVTVVTNFLDYVVTNFLDYSGDKL